MTPVVIRTRQEYIDALPEISCAEECTICCGAENDEKKLELPCGHAFHKQCLLPWLQQAHSCPCCRHELPGVAEVPESDTSFTRELHAMTRTERNARIRLLQRLDREAEEASVAAQEAGHGYSGTASSASVDANMRLLHEEFMSRATALQASADHRAVVLAQQAMAEDIEMYDPVTGEPLTPNREWAHAAAQLAAEEVVQQPGDPMAQAPEGLWWRRIGSRWVTAAAVEAGPAHDADRSAQPRCGNTTSSSCSTVPCGMWACHVCTLHNDNRNATCELCGTAQPAVEPAAACGGDHGCSTPASVVMPWEQTYTDGLTLAQRNARIRAVRQWEEHGTEPKHQPALMV